MAYILLNQNILACLSLTAQDKLDFLLGTYVSDGTVTASCNIIVTMTELEQFSKDRIYYKFETHVKLVWETDREYKDALERKQNLGIKSQLQFHPPV